MVLTLLHAACRPPLPAALGDGDGAQGAVAAGAILRQKLDHLRRATAGLRQVLRHDSHYRPPLAVFLYISGEAPLYGAPQAPARSSASSRRCTVGGFAVEHQYCNDSLPFALLDLPNLAYLNSGRALLDIVAFRGFAAAQLAQRHGDAAAGGGPWVAFVARTPARWRRGCNSSTCTSQRAAARRPSSAPSSRTPTSTSTSAAPSGTSAPPPSAPPTSPSTRGSPWAKASATVKASFDAAALSDGDLRLLLADAHAMAVQYGYKEMVCGPMVAARRAGHDLVSALANFTTSFFYPTLEQGGSREYDAAYLAVEQIDPAMTGRQWRYQQCSEVGWFQNAPAKDAVRSPKLDAAYQRAACARIFRRAASHCL